MSVRHNLLTLYFCFCLFADVRTQAMYQMMDQGFVGLIFSCFIEDKNTKVLCVYTHTQNREKSFCNFNRVAREGFSEKGHWVRTWRKWGSKSCGSWGKSVPGRGNSQCKDPEVSVACSGDIEEVSVAAAEWGRLWPYVRPSLPLPVPVWPHYPCFLFS